MNGLLSFSGTSLILVLLLLVTGVAGQEPGFCGDCFCIPASGEICPYELEPNMEFTSFLPNLLEFEWQNPVTLNCNPYLNETECDLEPTPRTPGGACLIEIFSPDDGSTCPTNWTYRLERLRGPMRRPGHKAYTLHTPDHAELAPRSRISMSIKHRVQILQTRQHSVGFVELQVLMMALHASVN